MIHLARGLAITGTLGLFGCSLVLSFEDLPDGDATGLVDGRRTDGADGAPLAADATPPVDALCLGAPTPATRLDPTVVLAVDASGSMSEALGAGSRYDVVRSSMVGTLLPSIPPPVLVGMLTFTRSSAACPATTSVAPAVDNQAGIALAMSRVSPSGQAALGEAITAAAAVGDAVAPSGRGRILLVTDSPPVGCTTVASPLAEAVAATSAAAAGGWSTHLVAVGTELLDAEAQAIADAGASAPPGAGTPFQRVTDPTQLDLALLTALGELDFCRFQPADALGAAGLAQVTLDGRVLPGGQWLVEGEQVVLLGAACALARDGGPHAVEVRRRCSEGTVPPAAALYRRKGTFRARRA